MANTGQSNETVTSDLHGKYYTKNYNAGLGQRMIVASITTASAIPLAATNATPNFILWNPSGNTNNLVLVRLNVGFSAGTGVASAIGWSYIPGAGASIATAAAISVLTTTATSFQTGIAGTSYSGNIKFGSAATVTGTAPFVPVRWRWTNLSQGAPITSTASAWNLFEDYEGTAIIPPGVAIYLDATPAPAETFMITVIAYEQPTSGTAI